jgi:hypothetical protein
LGKAGFVLALGVAVSIPACDGLGGSRDPAGLTPEEFISIVVELRRAERELEEADSAAERFEARRAEILAEHEATEEDVRNFAARRGGDLDLMNALWDTINQRLRYLPRPDTPAGRREAPVPPSPAGMRDTAIR